MQKILKPLFILKARTWLAIVATISLLERVLLYLFYRPVAYHDTASYRRLAEAVLDGWTRYDGTRVPGYPAFLALIGSDERVYAAQLALGFLTTLLFFYIGWRVSGKGWFGALAALAHTLNLQQLFFEANLITESLATFFIAAWLAGIAWLLFSGHKQPFWQTLLMALASGVTGGLAALTRPLYVFLPFWAAFFLLIFWRTAAPKVRWSAALAAGLTGLFIIAAWVNFIHQRFGIWSVTTMSGYHLVQHTGLFFEYVPDEYAAIRDTYIQYRQARVAQTGAPGNAIWDAIPALQEVSGLGFVPLSNLLAKISIQLILEHPGLYLRSLLQGWLWFWKAPIYWSPAGIANLPVRGILSAMIGLERGGMMAANVAFIFGSLTLICRVGASQIKVRQTLKMDAFLWFVASTVWLTSILQTLLDHGDNPRFLVPVQSLVVFLVLWWGLQITRRFVKGKHESVSA